MGNRSTNRTLPANRTARASRTQGDSGVGLGIIVAYKFARGTLFLSLALILVVTLLAGEAHRLRTFADMLREHLTGVWSLRLANLLVRVSTPRHLTIASIALATDGLFSFFEGWSLRRRFAWAPWLVVIATSSFLPWEMYEIYRHVRIGRILVLLINLAVLIYLYRRERRAARRSHPSSG